MKTRKVQVTLDEPDYQALVRVADRQHRKLAALVRESIERYLVGPESGRERRAALAALFALDAPAPREYASWEFQYSSLVTETTEAAPVAARTERAGPTGGTARGGERASERKARPRSGGRR